MKVDLEKFLSPMLAFITGEISAGRNVLVHCLAGAHRSITNIKINTNNELKPGTRFIIIEVIKVNLSF